MLLPLALALAAAPAVLIAGSLAPRLAAPLGIAFSASSFATLLWGWLAGGGTFVMPWVPSLGLELAFTLDGLAALYGLLATGIGTAVLVYSSRYIPLHLAHEDRPPREAVRFFYFVLLFMGSMVGLALAQDLILLFVFWDITAIASYYLIGFDRHSEEARASAMMALLVTGVTAVFLLVGALLLHAEYGTFSIPGLVAVAEPGPLLTAAGLLIAVAGLAKSAQVPLHFWLPRAMAAPTPVSAYLHSAAMVAAGVFLLARTYPLLQQSPFLLDLFLVVGAASILYGGVIALTRNGLKQLLAYSTIAQYGYVLLFYGMGGPYGAGGAAFYVIAHGLAKSALFLTAGTVTEATGAKNLSEAGGLARRLPLLAAASGIAAATLASLPFTIGFFKDEFLFAAALSRGTGFVVITVLAAASTVAYTWRFWSGIFLGAPRGEGAKGAAAALGAEARGARALGAAAVPARLVWPIVTLAGIALVGGLWPQPFAALAMDAGLATFGAPTPLDARYHAALLPEYLLAAAAIGLGALLVVTRRAWLPVAQWAARLDQRAGAERAYVGLVHGLNVFSDRVHQLEISRLRSRVASVLVPTGLLVVIALVATGTSAPFRVGAITPRDIPLVAALLVTAVAAVSVTITRGHVPLVLVLSGTGFSLAVIYAFWGAPNVGLVAVLIETMLTLLLVGTIALLPRRVLVEQKQLPLLTSRRLAWVSVLAAIVIFPTVWGALSYMPAGTIVAGEYLELTPLAHALNVVSAILADFRGMDTMGEITVVALAALGVGSLVADIAPSELRRQLARAKPAAAPESRVVMQGVARVLYLPAFMIAAALLVKGFVDTGDGFSAGMVAALGVLLRYLAFGHESSKRLPVVRHARPVAFVGLLIALATAFGPLLWGEALLTHYPPAGVSATAIGSIELITAVLFDIGVFVLVLGFAVGVMTNIARVANGDLARGEEP